MSHDSVVVETRGSRDEEFRLLFLDRESPCATLGVNCPELLLGWRGGWRCQLRLGPSLAFRGFLTVIHPNFEIRVVSGFFALRYCPRTIALRLPLPHPTAYDAPVTI
jgi:hypothetical protein